MRQDLVLVDGPGELQALAGALLELLLEGLIEVVHPESQLAAHVVEEDPGDSGAGGRGSCDEGRVAFRGRPLIGLRPDQITALGVCRTFQNIRLFANMTAIENVLVGMHARVPLGLWDALTHRPRARLVLDRERLCALGPEVAAYVTAISQRRRRVLAEELAACLALEAQHGADGLRRAAAACVARDTCGAEYLLLFAGTQPALAIPDLPDQAAVDRDLAVYEAFVGR